MLRSHLTDAAIQAAKGRSHETVAVEHVLFAAAKHFRDRPDVAQFLPLAKAALKRPGSAIHEPLLDAAAAALLSSFTSEEAVLRELRKAFEPSTSTTTTAAAAQERSTPAHDTLVAATEPIHASSQAETVHDVLAELDALVGLGPVKRQLRRIAAVVQGNQERVKAGLAPVGNSLHLVFTGPPGTGKSTVARIAARLYAAAGALPGANFTEATRADLVAGFVGQTAIKTAQVIQRTRPGVLFIDEAYSLAPSHHGDFGAEAIATLVKAMEDYRSQFAVIVAGYAQETMQLISSNPGLKSRFQTYIAFPDYSPEELVTIFEGLASRNSVALGPGVHEKAQQVFVKAAVQPGYGNARFARALFEEAFAHVCVRAAADGRIDLDELATLLIEDIEVATGPTGGEARRIGFMPPG
jgi:SpoVK/Ycf46/Vps4 family AAA+-type ATPase